MIKSKLIDCFEKPGLALESLHLKDRKYGWGKMGYILKL